MKRAPFIILPLLLMIACHISFGQASMLMGKVVDANNKPISGAIIRVSETSNAVETKSDGDGLYYTKLLPTGAYHIEVLANGKQVAAEKIYFTAEGPKKYYILRLKENILAVETTEKNVFMDTRLSKIEAKNDPYKTRILDGTLYLMKRDTATGKLIPAWDYGEKVPQMKEIK